MRLRLAFGCCIGLSLFHGVAFAQSADEDAEACRDLWEAIGLPEMAGDADDADIVCHTGYVLAHNSETRTPDWVVEHVTREIADGRNTRPKVKFKTEPNLPAGTPRAVDDDYAGSGFDRGHQAPSADFKSSRELMIDTFFLSNAVPQEGEGFNQEVWQELEALVQKLAIDRGELYVITGPVNQPKRTVKVKASADACAHAVELEPLPDKAIGDNDVAVPSALYKIIYDPARRRVNAYLLANIDHRPLRDGSSYLDYLEQYRVGVGTVESLTGYRFFGEINQRARRILREKCPATMLH